MSDATRWWWIRHAPVAGQGKRLYGQQDVPCEIEDGDALRSLAAALPTGAQWVTSHLSRTVQTARALADMVGNSIRPLVERDLAEQDFGEWQGMTWDEIKARDTDASDAFWRDPARAAPPGGESFAALMERTAAVIERLTTDHRGRDIVAVAHGGTIRAALALALDLGPEQGMAVTIDTLSLSRLDHVADGLLRGRGGVWRVAGLNLPYGGLPYKGLPHKGLPHKGMVGP